MKNSQSEIRNPKSGRGKLYLCATPIGNLEDVTLRVLRILGEVDLIAAEDTRRTRKLLARYDIHRPLISFNQTNEKRMLPSLLAKLKQGAKIAVVSDAGMPGIADPGHSLVTACLDGGIDYELLPGASAALAAAVISGLPTHDLRFLGFLPRRQNERRWLLKSVIEQPSTLIFYESPRRLRATLTDIDDILESRRLAIIREMTKKFEEHRWGTAAELLASVGEQPLKGEIVLVLEGAKDMPAPPAEKIKEEIIALYKQGFSKKEAAKLLAEKYRVSRRRVYSLALELKG